MIADPILAAFPRPVELSDEAIERAVLACCLQDRHYLGSVDEVIASGVTAEWFSTPPRQATMRAIVRLHERGERIDLLSLRAVLADEDASAWAEAAYTDLQDVDQLPIYIDRLRELVIRRRIYDLSRSLLTRCVTADCSSLVNDFRRAAESIEGGMHTGRGIVSIGDALEPVLASMDRDADEILGVPTGFADIDALLLGLESGKLYLLGARPRVGKTALAMNIASNVARRGHRVLYVTLEIGQREVAERGLSAEAPVDYRSLRTAKLFADEKGNARETVEQMTRWPLDLLDCAALTLAELHSHCRWEMRKGGLALVIVDYLQLMRGRGTNREQEVASVARGLKELAKGEGVAVLALAQLSRETDKRGGDSRPNLSDLRESGELEQSADVVAFLFREELVNPNDEALKGKAEFIVRKNRSGEERTVELVWQGHYQRYRSAARSHQQQQYRQLGFGGAA